jgi:predicted small integral membrane protein
MTVSEKLRWMFWRLFEAALWALLLGFFVLMYVWYNEEPAERWQRRTIENEQVRAGDYLILNSRLYRSKVCRAWVERRMYDGIGAETKFEPDVQENQYIGLENRTVKVPVPITASPGPSLYKPRACWQCNPLQKFFPHCADLEPLKFIILPPAHLPSPQQQQQPSVETRPSP